MIVRGDLQLTGIFISCGSLLLSGTCRFIAAVLDSFNYRPNSKLFQKGLLSCVLQPLYLDNSIPFA